MNWGDEWVGAGGWASEGPAVRVFSPGPDETLGKQDAIYFEIRSLEPFHITRVVAHYRGQASEIAFDGTAFLPLYRASTRTAIDTGSSDDTTDGYAIEIRRLGGWPESPRLEVTATDDLGNVSIFGGSPIPSGGS